MARIYAPSFAFGEAGNILVEQRAVTISIKDIKGCDALEIQEGLTRLPKRFGGMIEAVEGDTLTDLKIKTAGSVKGRSVADIAMRELKNLGWLDESEWRKARESLGLSQSKVQWFFPADDTEMKASDGMVMVSDRHVLLDLHASRGADIGYILEGVGVYAVQGWVKTQLGASDIRVRDETKSAGGVTRMEFRVDGRKPRDAAREWAKFVMKKVLLEEGKWLRSEECENASKAFGRERG